jgi:hypothetical protein
MLLFRPTVVFFATGMAGEPGLHLNKQTGERPKVAAELCAPLPVLFYIYPSFRMFELCDAEHFCFQ